jgi:8-oxo-dGTP pyrophosphatase MutT (NUDIX family)
MIDSELPRFLIDRLQKPLPGAAAQRLMEPELSYGRHRGPAQPDARPAAVVAALHMIDGQWYLPLMIRPDTAAHHAGQISLPGGTVEAGETSEAATLRELEEELGISRSGTLLLGRLTDVYVYGTNFLITPWVAMIEAKATFRPSPAEVEEILQIPLVHLLDPANRGQHIEQRGSLRFVAPHFRWHEHTIWGATSMILAELADLLAETA